MQGSLVRRLGDFRLTPCVKEGRWPVAAQKQPIGIAVPTATACDSFELLR
jgi:hypothetical protein